MAFDTSRIDELAAAAALAAADGVIIGQSNVLTKSTLSAVAAFMLGLLSAKTVVACATTTNITLSGEQTVDNVLTSNSRVFVKDHAIPALRGIYVSAAGAWARADDMNAWSEVAGALVTVSAGTTNADTVWLCTNDASGILDTTSITFIKLFGANLYQPYSTFLVQASVANFRSNSANYALGTKTVWSSAALVALSDAATIAVDLSTGFNFSVTLGGNRTLGNPTNTKVGQSGIIAITQDGAGSRTLAYDTSWEFVGGVAPTLTTTIAAKDVLHYLVQSSTSILAWLSPDMK